LCRFCEQTILFRLENVSTRERLLENANLGGLKGSIKIPKSEEFPEEEGSSSERGVRFRFL
jgi:hypothetical protein